MITAAVQGNNCNFLGAILKTRLQGIITDQLLSVHCGILHGWSDPGPTIINTSWSFGGGGGVILFYDFK